MPQPLTTWLVATVVIICHSAQAQIPFLCDHFGEAVALRCVGPLVEYVNLEHQTLHPPLSNPDLLCRRFTEYQRCTIGVAKACRSAIARHMEHMYEFMCDTKFRSNVTDQRQCFLGLTVDASVRQCYVNKTNQLRDEHHDSIRVLDHRTSNNVLVIGAGLTMDNETAKFECRIMQHYMDCLLENDYGTNCPVATELEYKLLNHMSGSACKLTMEEKKIDISKPTCDKKSGVCTCSEGFTYDNELNVCQDVDECAQPNGCSQKCINMPGSYECHCDARYYELQADQKTCLRKDQSPLWIFFAHGQSIWNISQDGKNFQLQRAGLQKTAMLDIDIKERRLYYADIGANTLERINIEGAFPQPIQQYEVESLEGLAVDWVARNLYTLRKTDIFVQQLDGRYRKTLYRNVMKLPRALAVHPTVGRLYATDWSADAFIACAAMDGSSFEQIVTEGVVWPNALTIDYYADKIYWADAFLDTIESADLNGQNRRTIVSESSSVPHVFGLAVADDYLYWTDWTYRGILRANKLTGDNVTVLAQTALLPYGIKIFHPSMQPEAENPCVRSSVGCSQLCLLRPKNNGSYTESEPICGCSDGFHLEKDGRTCTSNCKENDILCGGSDPRCISKLYWCDGVAQCRGDQADERDCPPRICLPGQFQCHDNTKCLTPGSLCDGEKQCDDGSDEKYC